jgi:hypothetical protein
MALSTMDLFVAQAKMALRIMTLDIEYCYAKCHDLFINMPSVVMLSVFMLSVVMLDGVATFTRP